MIFFDNLKNFIRNANRKEMIQYGAIYVGICTIGMIGIFIRHIIMANDLDAKLTQLNKARTNVQQIFTQFQRVQHQKNKIEELLKKNKTFYIQKYIQDLLNQHRLSNQSTPRFASEKLPNGYIQETVALTLNAISTQQMCEFLIALQQQPLVYVLFIDIAQNNSSKKNQCFFNHRTLRAEE